MIRLASRAQRPAPSWHARFLAMLPAIEAHARIAFRGLRPEAREDAVQETIANALVAFVRLVQPTSACRTEARKHSLCRGDERPFGGCPSSIAISLRNAHTVRNERDSGPQGAGVKWLREIRKGYTIPGSARKVSWAFESGCSAVTSPIIRVPDQSHLCDTRPIWTPWGWAMDRSRLAWLLANWCTGNPKCFTCKIKAQYRRTRRELFPLLSRIQNIGYDQGENGRTAEWYRTNHRTPWVAPQLAVREFSCPVPVGR